jgi:hypothetical protein
MMIVDGVSGQRFELLQGGNAEKMDKRSSATRIRSVGICPRIGSKRMVSVIM